MTRRFDRTQSSYTLMPPLASRTVGSHSDLLVRSEELGTLRRVVSCVTEESLGVAGCWRRRFHLVVRVHELDIGWDGESGRVFGDADWELVCLFVMHVAVVTVVPGTCVCAERGRFRLTISGRSYTVSPVCEGSTSCKTVEDIETSHLATR